MNEDPTMAFYESSQLAKPSREELLDALCGAEPGAAFLLTADGTIEVYPPGQLRPAEDSKEDE